MDYIFDRGMKLILNLAGAVCLLLGCQGRSLAANPDYVENSTFSTVVRVLFTDGAEPVVSGTMAGVDYELSDSGLIFSSTISGVEYVLSGTSTRGYVKINSEFELRITLHGLDLTSPAGPAVIVSSTNRCFLVLAEGTSNSLSDASTYAVSGNGVVSASGPLIISGQGSLAIMGNKKHGLSSDAYLRVREGVIAIASAPKDGIHVNKFFQMDHGCLAISSVGDGIDGDEGCVEINGGSIRIRSVTANVSAIKCKGSLTVNGGAVELTVDGAESKGLNSEAELTINGGTLLCNLTGTVNLNTIATVATNGAIITTNTYIDPAYCTAIKCATNLTINQGAIHITHQGLAGKGISAEGNILIRGGVVDIFSSGGSSTLFTNQQNVVDVAASDCIKADLDLTILGGVITAECTGNAGDAISAEGKISIGTIGVADTPVISASTKGQQIPISGSGMSAEYANPKALKAVGDLTVNGGRITASTKYAGGEGLESNNRLTINGGAIEVSAYDDCINASKSMVINGGNIYCYSQGNDGIDSNGPLEINGGIIVTSGTTAPEEGFDCDMNTFTIRGGILVGTGGATSTPTSSACTQRSVLYTTTGTAGTVVQVKSATGDNLVYTIPRTYTSGGGGGRPGGGPSGGGGMLLIFSNPALAAGTTYSIITGATITGGTDFHGLHLGASAVGGTTLKTFTTSTTSMVTTVN